MSARAFYLAAYDITNGRRRRAALALLRGYISSSQKSTHELHLSTREHAELLHQMSLLLDTTVDRLFLLRLDPDARCHSLGVAGQRADPEYFYVG